MLFEFAEIFTISHPLWKKIIIRILVLLIQSAVPIFATDLCVSYINFPPEVCRFKKKLRKAYMWLSCPLFLGLWARNLVVYFFFSFYIFSACFLRISYYPWGEECISFSSIERFWGLLRFHFAWFDGPAHIDNSPRPPDFIIQSD